MSPRSKPLRRPVGRPSAGAKAGEKVKDYPQLSVRVPPDIKHRVAVLSEMRCASQWHIITEAIESYLRDLPARERAAVEKAARRRNGS